MKACLYIVAFLLFTIVFSACDNEKEIDPMKGYEPTEYFGKTKTSQRMLEWGSTGIKWDSFPETITVWRKNQDTIRIDTNLMVFFPDKGKYIKVTDSIIWHPMIAKFKGDSLEYCRCIPYDTYSFKGVKK